MNFKIFLILQDTIVACIHYSIAKCHCQDANAVMLQIAESMNSNFLKVQSFSIVQKMANCVTLKKFWSESYIKVFKLSSFFKHYVTIPKMIHQQSFLPRHLFDTCKHQFNSFPAYIHFQFPSIHFKDRSSFFHNSFKPCKDYYVLGLNGRT